MGCGSSKTAVQTLENNHIDSLQTSANLHNSKSTTKVNNTQEVTRETLKSSSAKSRDSGIQEMDNLSNSVFPNSIPDIIEPLSPLPASKLDTVVHQRLESKTILQELEAQGLIKGSKVERDGTAFEVSLDPIIPIKKAPARLERLKYTKKRALTKEKLEIKMKKAQARRMEHERSKSRMGSKMVERKTLQNLDDNQLSAMGDVSKQDQKNFDQVEIMTTDKEIIEIE